MTTFLKSNMEISREIVNGKSRVVGTFNIVFNGAEKPVKIKKLNFGEYNELQRACLKMTMLGGQPKMDLDPVAMNENSIFKSLLDAPFPIEMTAIRELDREVAEEILSNVNDINMPTDKKKEN